MSKWNHYKTMIFVDNGGNPNEMAAAIYTIIQNPSPKIHYKVAPDTKIFDCLKGILPDKVYEKC
jgi:hypothetical protein